MALPEWDGGANPIVMKCAMALISAIVFSASSLVAGVSFYQEAITDADVGNLKNFDDVILSECNADKIVIKFNSSGYITIHYRGFGSSQNLSLSERNSSVTLLTCSPKDGPALKRLTLSISGKCETMNGYCYFDSGKTNFVRSEITKGMFQMTASPNKDFSDPTYDIQVSISDRAPEKDEFLQSAKSKFRKD
jgi:hypothetical protein